MLHIEDSMPRSCLLLTQVFFLLGKLSLIVGRYFMVVYLRCCPFIRHKEFGLFLSLGLSLAVSFSQALVLRLQHKEKCKNIQDDIKR
jgi:hypothetical protein